MGTILALPLISASLALARAEAKSRLSDANSIPICKIMKGHYKSVH